jgi:hypothetical protein
MCSAMHMQCRHKSDVVCVSIPLAQAKSYEQIAGIFPQLLGVQTRPIFDNPERLRLQLVKPGTLNPVPAGA